MPTWLITGCSTGLGRALAQAALDRGDNVAATARDAATTQPLVDAHPKTALALTLDVTNPAQVTAAVSAAEERFGAIDVLVNNAGYGYRSAVEEAEDSDVQTLFATNFFGPVALIKAVLPRMHARRDGAIVNISSIGARLSPPGSGYYAASKAAVEALTASLRKEVEPLGITAMIVEPVPSAPTSTAVHWRSPAIRSMTTPTPPAGAARSTTPQPARSKETLQRRRTRSSQPLTAHTHR